MSDLDDDWSDSGASEDDEPTPVDAWLEPVSEDAPCGEDLEYDNDFLELEVAARGKPEQQFGDKIIPAEEPDWRDVKQRAESLLERTRDLRVALYWLRAALHEEQFPALAWGLKLVRGQLERFWDDMYPKLDPEDGNDPFMRLSALSVLADPAGVLHDLRGAAVIRSRAVGELRVRDVELAVGRLEPREDEEPRSRDQVRAMLRDAEQAEPGAAAAARNARAELDRLGEVLSERVGFGQGPDLEALQAMIDAVVEVMPKPQGASGADESADYDADASFGAGEDDGGFAAAAAGRGAGGGASLSGGVSSRAEAIRAIDMVCAYLESAEPTNPAQLLLRRARHLIGMNFLQLVRELAPEALSEVAKVMGVSPDAVGDAGAEGDAAQSDFESGSGDDGFSSDSSWGSS